MSKFAVVFPGQGSQSVGMLDAWGDHPEVVRTVDESSNVLDRDLKTLIHAGPKEQLDLTTNTQVVMLVAGLACYRAWVAETGLTPVAMAGHSLGATASLMAALDQPSWVSGLVLVEPAGALLEVAGVAAALPRTEGRGELARIGHAVRVVLTNQVEGVKAGLVLGRHVGHAIRIQHGHFLAQTFDSL